MIGPSGLVADQGPCDGQLLLSSLGYGGLFDLVLTPG